MRHIHGKDIKRSFGLGCFLKIGHDQVESVSALNRTVFALYLVSGTIV